MNIDYRQQHVTFVQHANTTIQSLEQQKIAMEEEIAKAEAAILQRSQQQQGCDSLAFTYNVILQWIF